MVQLRIKVALRSFGLMSLISWRSGLKKYRKAAALRTSFIFYVAFRATGVPVRPTWLYIAGPRWCSYRVCNRGVLNRDFSADSGTQCLRVYLMSFNTVGQGRSCFSLKLLTNNYKLNVFGSFFV